VPRPAARALPPLLILAAALSGCAKREPPSGGPLDLEPPRVIASVPDSGAAGVRRNIRPSIEFSENMDPRSTTDAVSLAPRVEIRQRRWSGRTLTLVLAETLGVNRTYTLFLGNSARDEHGNRMASGRTVVFSTAPQFPPGVIEGEIQALGFPVAGTYLWCYDAAAGQGPDSTARDFHAVGLADEAGKFRVSGLDVPGRYRLWAFADLNANRSFEPASDVLAPVDTVFELTAANPRASGMTVRVVNPRAPGRVRGAVLDSLADSLGVLRVMVFTPPDSSRALQFDVDAEGEFDFKLPPGTYRLRAYRDLDRSHSWQAEREPASDLESIEVPPAADVLGVRLALRRAREKP
jgi:hypothetical protein